MLDRFAAAFAILPPGQTPGPPHLDPALDGVRGYRELMERFAGVRFEDGLYRIFDAGTGARALELVREVFPEFGDDLSPFGMDWQGRMLALDRGRVVDGEPQVMLLEPGTGQALEVPFGLETFHEQELVENPEPALLPSVFEEFSRRQPDRVPLGPGQVVGYSVPLFLGGRDDYDNYEVSDWDVYWTLLGQLKARTAGLPEGSPVRRVR